MESKQRNRNALEVGVDGIKVAYLFIHFFPLHFPQLRKLNVNNIKEKDSHKEEERRKRKKRTRNYTSNLCSISSWCTWRTLEDKFAFLKNLVSNMIKRLLYTLKNGDIILTTGPLLPCLMCERSGDGPIGPMAPLGPGTPGGPGEPGNPGLPFGPAIPGIKTWQ